MTRSTRTTQPTCRNQITGVGITRLRIYTQWFRRRWVKLAVTGAYVLWHRQIHQTADRFKAAIKPRVVGRDARRCIAVECLGLRQKPRVVSSRRSFDSTLICVFISFSFTPFSSSLCLFVRFVSTLSHRTSTPPSPLTVYAGGLIGELANYRVKRSVIRAVTRNLV